MQLTYDYIHLKADSNSKLNGYWTSDIGGLNEITHIWEYGNFLFSHKSLVSNCKGYNEHSFVFGLLLNFPLLFLNVPCFFSHFHECLSR